MENSVLIAGIVLAVLLAGYAAYEAGNSKNLAVRASQQITEGLEQQRLQTEVSYAQLQERISANEQNANLAPAMAVKWIKESCRSEPLHPTEDEISCEMYCQSIGRMCLLGQEIVSNDPNGGNRNSYEVIGCRSSYVGLLTQRGSQNEISINCMCCGN